jgi:perosamine synthetase
MSSKKIPWSIPDISINEEEAVAQVMKSKWLGMGPKTKELEKNICDYTRARSCIVVNNGTSALITALIANGIGPGEKVLVPTYTFIATVNSVIAIGARPILVDCDPTTFNVSIESLVNTLNENPDSKCLIFVDVAGLPADIDQIREIAQKRNLVLIEDAAEAFGAEYEHKKIGSFDHTAIFSFHVAKQMTMVEGGAVVTGNLETAERCRLIRSHGEGKEKYIHIDIGLNFRPTDIQSALGITQLTKVEEYLSLRKKIADIYISNLENLVDFQRIPEYVTRHPWMLFMCLTKDNRERDALNKFINERGIDTRIPWPPAHIQPYHRSKLGPSNCPNAEKVYERVLSLPIGNAISEADAHIVVQEVKKYYAQR